MNAKDKEKLDLILRIQAIARKLCVMGYGNVQFVPDNFDDRSMVEEKKGKYYEV